MQEINKSNPLLKHFRQPALYIELTSKGRFWPDTSLELPVTGKIPVYPMTTRDEITLRTPDALINGTSVVEVIQSCCPNIKNAWDMPSIDVDSTLIAIRIASYGPSMPIKSQCPHCNEEHEYDINLSGMLTSIVAPNYDAPVTLDNGLTVYLKPMNYRNISKTGEVGLEEERLIQTLADPDLTEEQRKVGYEKHLKTMVDLSISTMANCTHSIVIDDGETVTDFNFIKEFYANADGKVLRFIQAQLAEYTKDVNIKPVQAQCDNEACGKSFDITVNFDYAGFFDRGF
jgi:T4 bacteriophage base plate protein